MFIANCTNENVSSNMYMEPSQNLDGFREALKGYSASFAKIVGKNYEKRKS